MQTIKQDVTYEVQHTVENGIERISYIPRQPRFQTPILLQHGMYHNARCWRLWQELFAQWGWESHAISLPGHGDSPTQRSIRWCTLSYYLKFVRAEVERLARLKKSARPPILIGHSMGGALVQWYLKHVGDLAAAVLVAPWSSHGAYFDGLRHFYSLDPLGVFMIAATGTATPMIRTPQRAARMFLTEGAALSPEALHAQLGPESSVVILQHLAPFWYPPENVKTPLLWLAGEKDAVISETVERRSAEFYHAEYHVIRGAAHNLMMEHNYCETATMIHEWLSNQNLS